MLISICTKLRSHDKGKITQRKQLTYKNYVTVMAILIQYKKKFY